MECVRCDVCGKIDGHGEFSRLILKEMLSMPGNDEYIDLCRYCVQVMKKEIIKILPEQSAIAYRLKEE